MNDSASGLRVADFDFDLPAELIAQRPPPERGQSRMLVMNREGGDLRDAQFSEFPTLLRAGDLLVLNDSRVIPARLFARRTLRREREKPTGRIEVMLTEQAGCNRGAVGFRVAVRTNGTRSRSRGTGRIRGAPATFCTGG
jgi:S-adenosylmethionine:tRNA ribosyltransferase-isomerase